MPTLVQELLLAFNHLVNSLLLPLTGLAVVAILILIGLILLRAHGDTARSTRAR